MKKAPVKILLDLLKIYNPSGREKAISTKIIGILKNNAIPFYKDEYNNIYNFTYNNVPFLNAHLDSIQKGTDEEHRDYLVYENDIIRSKVPKIIGADDKVGVFVILYLLINTKLKFNWIFTVSEEIGCFGSKYFADNYQKELKKNLFCIVIDRKGAGKIVCSQNKYGSLEFENELANVGKKYGFSPAEGKFCDANVWKYHLNSCNISCGYYNAHTENEYIKVSNVFNTISFIKDIILNIKKECPRIIFDHDFEKELMELCIDSFFDEIHTKKDGTIINRYE